MELCVGQDRLQVAPDSGGRITSWTADGHELLVGPSASREAEGWGSYPMVPWAGRVRDGVFRWQGRAVQLPRPAGPHALHGVGHRSSWTVLGQAEDRVEMGLRLPSAADGWPFGGEVSQTVRLTEGAVEVSMAVTAGSEAMPLMVGWHPWFTRWLGGAEARVDLQAGRMLVRGADGLPTGQWAPPSVGPWDDCFTDLSVAPEVTWPGVGAVTVDSDLDHLVVFDQHHAGVCVEPQSGPPDEFNTDAPRTLAPGASFSARMTLRWTSA